MIKLITVVNNIFSEEVMTYYAIYTVANVANRACEKQSFGTKVAWRRFSEERKSKELGNFAHARFYP